MYTFIAPSLYAHIIGGFLFFISLIMIIMNYKNMQKVSIYNSILLLLIYAIFITIHGISHIELERVYNYNPIVTLLENK